MGEGFVRGWGWWALVFVLRVVLKKKEKKMKMEWKTRSTRFEEIVKWMKRRKKEEERKGRWKVEVWGLLDTLVCVYIPFVCRTSYSMESSLLPGSLSFLFFNEMGSVWNTRRIIITIINEISRLPVRDAPPFFLLEWQLTDNFLSAFASLHPYFVVKWNVFLQ